MNCSEFEENLSSFLEGGLSRPAYKAAAEHAMKCPLCHSLLNDVKESMAACRSIGDARAPLTRLEARILANTVPQSEMHCTEFEGHLTDYLDGFLPAPLFHRWERHAVLCGDCTDLPGTVVRSLAAIVTLKLEELPVPAGLNERILLATIGSEPATAVKPSLKSRIWDAIGDIRIPISVPQLAPVALMLMFAFLFVSQTVSADGSLSDVYLKSISVAEETYRQSAEAFRGSPSTIGGPQAVDTNSTTGEEHR